jgi:DNA-binding transcriptional regulator YdaS (Cro superfamily)
MMDIQKLFDENSGMRARIAKRAAITISSVSQWRRVPAERAVLVSEETGVPLHVLRPDIFPAPGARDA